jgi:molecular chaperone DnaK
VTFDIDANGILSVKAVDKATNKEQTIVIKSSSGLGENDIEKMVQDAKQYEEEDKKKKAHIELRNRADSTVYQIEKALDDYKKHSSSDEVAAIEKGLAEVKEALKADDADRIQRSMDELLKLSHKAVEAMYKASAAQGAPGAAQPGPDAGPQAPGNGKDGVIDADFEEVK